MSIEAMKQALDWFKCYRDKSMSRNNAEELAVEIEEELRTAIDQAEKQEHSIEVRTFGSTVTFVTREPLSQYREGDKFYKHQSAAPVQETTDWERIARVQDAKLRAMCNEPGAFEELCKLMDKYEAMRPTPAAPVQDQGQSCYCPNCEVLSKQLAAQPAPVQEPVAYIAWPELKVASNLEREKTNVQLWTKRVLESDVALYTAPFATQRKWVSLTDEEVNSLRYKLDWTGPWTDMTFARAIEAKLREKNGGQA